MITGREQSQATYWFFSDREGNQHIASLYALERAIWLAGRLRAQSVLEIGLGIGSLAHALMAAYPRLRYTGTEANPFCLSQLPSNLGPLWRRVRLYPDLAHLPPERFDLVIVDGSDDALNEIGARLTPHGAVYIEGDRKPQVAAIRAALGPQSLAVSDISHRKNPEGGPFSPSIWSGGCTIIFPDPTPSQRLLYAHRRVLTAMWYRLRGSWHQAAQMRGLRGGRLRRSLGADSIIVQEDPE